MMVGCFWKLKLHLEVGESQGEGADVGILIYVSQEFA